jgi:hypothetical protein
MEIYVYNMYENYVPENETFATSLHGPVFYLRYFHTAYQMSAL